MKKVLILFGKSDWEKAKPFSNKNPMEVKVKIFVRISESMMIYYTT
jgi:hypothetical protein